MKGVRDGPCVTVAVIAVAVNVGKAPLKGSPGEGAV